MKLTKIILGNKLTKLTNSHQNSQKLTSKLTFYPATIRRPIAEISNYIRYLFFLCEFVSFTEVQYRVEIKKGENIQYRNSRGETHKTLKLTLPAGGV